MRNEFVQLINQVCAERNLSKEVVFEALEAALVSAYKRNFSTTQEIEAKIDPQTGQLKVFIVMEVVEEVTDPEKQMTLEQAREIQPDVEIGDTVKIETASPKEFGRIAAQTAKQVILQRIREAERDALYQSFVDRVGEMVTATVQTADQNRVTVNLGKAEGIMPRSERIPGERFRPNARVRVCIIDVTRGSRGPEIIVSRAHKDMLRRLLEMEVPEVFSGAVEIKSIAREAGARSKVAVAAKQPRLDPVGACVGQRGYRIQNIVGELNDEKIDIVAWSPDTATFIANALSPAKPVDVILDESTEGARTATVVVPDKQLSLAIGKEGQNVRLAAKLTGWRIDIKSVSEVEEEARAQKERAAAEPTEEDILAKAESILLGKEAVADDIVEEVFELPIAEEEAAPAPEVEAMQAEPTPADAQVTEVLAEPTAEEVTPEAAEAPLTEEAAEEAVSEEAPAPVVDAAVSDIVADWKEESAEKKDKAPKLTKKQRKKGKAPAKKDEMSRDIKRKPQRRRRRDWEDWDEE